LPHVRWRFRSFFSSRMPISKPRISLRFPFGEAMLVNRPFFFFSYTFSSSFLFRDIKGEILPWTHHRTSIMRQICWRFLATSSPPPWTIFLPSKHDSQPPHDPNPSLGTRQRGTGPSCATGPSFSASPSSTPPEFPVSIHSPARVRFFGFPPSLIIVPTFLLFRAYNLCQLRCISRDLACSPLRILPPARIPHPTTQLPTVDFRVPILVGVRAVRNSSTCFPAKLPPLSNRSSHPEQDFPPNILDFTSATSRTLPTVDRFHLPVRVCPLRLYLLPLSLPLSAAGQSPWSESTSSRPPLKTLCSLHLVSHLPSKPLPFLSHEILADSEFNPLLSTLSPRLMYHTTPPPLFQSSWHSKESAKQPRRPRVRGVWWGTLFPSFFLERPPRRREVPSRSLHTSIRSVSPCHAKNHPPNSPFPRKLGLCFVVRCRSSVVV